MKRAVFVIMLLFFSFAVSMLAGCNFSPSDSHSPTSSTLEETPDPEMTPSQPEIKDHINVVDENVLMQIASSYFIIFDFDKSFTEHDSIDYEKAYQYMKYAGVYRMNPFNIWGRPELMKYYDEKSAAFALPAKVVDELILEGKIECSELAESTMVDDTYIIDHYFWDIRPELHRYFNNETWVLTVPAGVVDEYILGKFSTTIERSQIQEYNETNDTYTFAPFVGSFHYSISIEQMTVEDNVVRFTCLATLHEDVQDNSSLSYRALFTISLIDGEYKYLTVEVTGNENS